MKLLYKAGSMIEELRLLFASWIDSHGSKLEATAAVEMLTFPS